MNARAFAILSLCLAGASAFGNDLMPDWMPPAPPRESIWDVLPEDPAPTGDMEFSQLLLFSRNSGLASADPERLKMAQTSITNFGKLSSNVDMFDPREPREAPYRDWKANQSLNMPLPVADSLFMFGNVDSSGDSLDHQGINMKGRTGLGWKWAPFGGSELQFKTGTLVSYANTPATSTSATSITSSTQLSVALQAKLDLWGPIQLQYSGEALPASSQTTDRKTLLTDVKLAMPLGTNQEVYLGAKYKWDDSLTPSPWVDRAQIYLGLKFQR